MTFCKHYLWYSVKRSDVTRRKQGYITPPPPHTSFCETQWRHSVKTKLYKNPPSYFIVLASSVETKEDEAIVFHRIVIWHYAWRFQGVFPKLTIFHVMKFWD